jgi:O-antigen ligase/tetratricopeptide (TPR) repeat protein
MSKGRVLPPELLAEPRNRWDLATEGLLAVLLAYMPLAFGAVEATSELVVIALAAALSLVVALRVAVDRTFRVPWTWTFVPLAAFVLLVAFQLAPLPRDWTAKLSPAAVATRTELLGPDDPAALAAEVPLSMYPYATAHGLRLVLVGVAVFFAVVATFRTAPQIKRVVLTVFCIGCAEAALALLQIITRADRLYWLIDPGTSRLTSGSFINYSNFSQFVNLSIGAGAALLLVRLHEEGASTRGRHDPSIPFGGASFSQQGGLLAGLILCAVAICTSLSRNGVLSLIAAGALVGTALFARGTLSRRGWVLAMLPLGALGVLLAFGFDVVYERLATLGDSSNQFADRWELTLGALRAWREFPIFGAGLGTHEFVYAMFDESLNTSLAAHADNDYAQLLEETGALGAVCVLIFLAFIITHVVRLCRRGRTPLSTATFGLAFGLLAVAIHSATDFGQHIPAVFCLSAVTCGLIVQLNRLDSEASSTGAGGGVAWRRAGAVMTLIGLAACWTWALRDAYAAHMGEQWWAAAYQIDSSIRQARGEADDQEFADLLAATEQAVAAEPQNVAYAFWLNLFRWQAISRDVDPATGQVLLSAEARPFVARIADDLAAVRRLCPTYGAAYALEGQLRLSILDDPTGEDLIRKGVRLAPYDAPTCLVAGEAAARAGRTDEALALLRRAVALNPGYFADVAQILLFELEHPEFARELAGDDFYRLAQLAEIAAGSEDYAALADELREEAGAAQRKRIASDAATPHELAAVAAADAVRGDYESAIELYSRAITADYSQADWHLGLARALAATGRDEEALEEAQRVLRLHPGHAQATELAEELSVGVDAAE